MNWKEDFLHFIWKYQLLNNKSLTSTRGERILVHKTGLHNQGQGPDFKHASVQIDQQIFHGHVEIHIDNKDWYNHKHQLDANYDNVILHVVLKNTDEAYTLTSSNQAIPILCIENHLSKDTLNNIETLVQSKKIISCQDIFRLPTKIVLEQFKSRLFIERIIRKSSFLQEILSSNFNHYEKSFYHAMLYGFGLKENSHFFLALAQSIPLSLIYKYIDQPLKLEALFFGQARLTKPVDDYSKKIISEYEYLQKLHQLEPISQNAMQSGMRPTSFPTIRLAQFIHFVQNNSQLYSKLTQFKELQEIYAYFNTSAGDYWATHYDFGKIEQKPSSRKLTKAFIDKIIINIILPFRFLREMQEEAPTEDTINLFEQIKPELNAKTTAMQNYLFMDNASAYDSQVLIEWYSNYCTLKKCLDCPIGLETLRRGIEAQE